MALLNYTTKTPVGTTIGEIQTLLAKAGATNVGVEYARGEPVAVAFSIDTPIGRHAFRLPADIDAIWKLLVRQSERGAIKAHVGRAFFTREQAARVGWRIVKDWLEAQLALIETEMVRLEQVMLPYLITEGGATLYEAFRDRQLGLPSARVDR